MHMFSHVVWVQRSGSPFNSPLGCLVLSGTCSLRKYGLLSLKAYTNESNSVQNSHHTHPWLRNHNHLDTGLNLHILWNYPKPIESLSGHVEGQASVCTGFLAAFTPYSIRSLQPQRRKTAHYVVSQNYQKRLQKMKNNIICTNRTMRSYT